MLKTIYSVLTTKVAEGGELTYSLHPKSFECLNDAKVVFDNCINEICECINEDERDTFKEDGYATDRLWGNGLDFTSWNVQIVETEVEYGEYFPVNVEVSREDLRDRGYDADKVSREEMYMLASRMGHMYLDGDYFVDLEYAAEYLCLPKKETNNQ